MSNYRWRIFYVVLELLKPAQLSISVGDLANKQTVFDLVSKVFTSILSGSGEVKNFNVKGVLMN